jgi:2'-5' RNA ligase
VLTDPRNHRLFFALLPNTRVRRKVIELQQSLACDGKAVRPDQLHVTLVFLGTQHSERIAELVEIASSLEFDACSISLDRLGGFRRARVAWLGAQDIPQAMVDFRESLAGRLAGAGFAFDLKPFKFHLTLYRHLRMPQSTMASEPVKWHVDGFSLMESVGIRNGVRYDCLGNWKGA